MYKNIYFFLKKKTYLNYNLNISNNKILFNILIRRRSGDLANFDLKHQLIKVNVFATFSFHKANLSLFFPFSFSSHNMDSRCYI